jgi:hypothetical protein
MYTYKNKTKQKPSPIQAPPPPTKMKKIKKIASSIKSLSYPAHGARYRLKKNLRNFTHPSPAASNKK